MKKGLLIGIYVLLAVVVLAVIWYLVSPLFIDEKVNEELPGSSNSVRLGKFVDADSFHKTAGEILVVEDGGKKYLRFENFEATNGPDLKVYLSNDLEAKDYVSLGDLKGNIGNQNYGLDDVDVLDYKYVLIWCEQFSVLFGIAIVGDDGSEVPSEKVKCSEEQRNKVCSTEYSPVCGWSGKDVQCFAYPCASNYGNPCSACSDEIVKYYTQGFCPKVGGV